MGLFGRRARQTDVPPRDRWSVPGGIEVSLFVGELADAPAEVLCTSTNPKLSMLGGTGSAVIERAGWGVRQEADEIVRRAREATGRAGLEVGSVHRTSAGSLPHPFLLHCVASGPGHAASAEAIRSCVRGVLAELDGAGIASLALPVLGAGHASFPFERAVRAIAEELASAHTSVQRVVLVVFDRHRLPDVRRVLGEAFPRTTG